VRIATFNINGVVKRLANLLAWLEETAPDVVCLQELKVAEPDFPRAAIEAAGYGAVWRGQRAWNGVAILARGAEPIVTEVALPGDEDDRQPRYIEAAVAGVLVASLYVPNGNPQPGPKFDYKLAWMERLRAHAETLVAAEVPAVLAGDCNVTPEPRDVYPTKSYDDNALVQPAPRAAYARLLRDGWTDAIRAVHPEATVYTFWDYRRKRWERDGGMRLDHLLLSPAVAGRLRDAGVDRAVRGLENASDHAPVWIELDDAG
jgi:exodeoxyribonuclease-3